MAKKLKLKLPKRVAGVRIPKAVRKGPVGQFLNSGAGQILIAEALVAAAGALAVSRSDTDSNIGNMVHRPIDSTRRVGRHAARASADRAANLSYALREAAQAFRDAMEAGPPEVGLRESTPRAESDSEISGEESAKNEAAAKKKQAPPLGEPSASH